jgi:4-hydroxy-2-oxoglutarate aldolase
VTARRLEGLLAPVTTPFDRATGAVAPEPLRRNLAALFADGLEGVVVAGSTGEAPLLDRDEQRALVAAARPAVPRDKWLVAGTGAEATGQAVALTCDAATAGADAVLVRPPAYYGVVLPPAALEAYFRAVADASPVPVLVYNIPKFTSVRLVPDIVARLADHPNIVGVKDSSGDIENFTAYRAAAPRWTMLVGSAALLLPALERGANGGVLGAACFAARRCVEILTAFRAGDHTRAADLQARLTPVDRRVVGQLGPAGIKAAVDAVGQYGGPVRAPLTELSADERREVAALVAA